VCESRPRGRSPEQGAATGARPKLRAVTNRRRDIERRVVRQPVLEMFVALHIGRTDHEMCRLAAELLQHAELNKDLARRARRDALQRNTAGDKARLLRHAAELDELATQLLLRANKFTPSAASTFS
jgi:hypothetical protein